MTVELSNTQHQLMKLHLTELVISEPSLDRADRHAFVRHVCAQRFDRRLSPMDAVAAANLLSKGLLAEASVLGKTAFDRSMTIRFSAAGAGMLFGMLRQTLEEVSRPMQVRRRVSVG